jgi:Ca-activated chloride channel family protein
LTDLLRFNNSCNRSSVLVMDQPQLLYILTEVEPGAQSSKIRLPINFALVLDRSGSMAGEKLHTMKEAVKSIIDQLEKDDILSIVTFESQTEVIASSQPALDKKGLKQLIDKIRDGGGTNIAQALKVALRMVSQNANENRVSRLVLLTDGEATDSEQDSFLVADEAGAHNIPIIGLGLGKDWNEEFIFQLADRSIFANPGSHTGYAEYIPDPNKACEIFQDVYQSMQVAAQNVTLKIQMVQGMEARRIWQVVPLIRELSSQTIRGRSIQIDITQLEIKGEAFLIEIMLPPRPAGKVRIAQADITFTVPEKDQLRQSADLILDYTLDASQADRVNRRVMEVLEKVQAFRLQTQALEDATSGDVGSATRKLRQAVTILLSQGETDLADQMDMEANRLEQAGEVSAEGKKTIMLTSRKTVRLSE